jgi:hypothetical protein
MIFSDPDPNPTLQLVTDLHPVSVLHEFFLIS